MRQHERDILSYRPDINFETKIHTLVESRIRPSQNTNVSDDKITNYHTAISKEFEEYNLATVLDAYEQMLETEKLMDEIILRGVKHDKDTGVDIIPDVPKNTDEDTVISSEQEWDVTPAIPPDNITGTPGFSDNIDPSPGIEDGNPTDTDTPSPRPAKDRDDDGVGDTPIKNPVFIAEKVKEEIDNVKDIISKIYDFDQNTVDLDDLRNREIDRVKDVIDKEKDDISYYVDYQFTDTERDYIDKLIRTRSSGVKSLDDYIKRLIDEHLERGSDRVDYPRLRDDVKRAFALSSLANSINKSGRSAYNTSNKRMDDVMGGDTQGGLVHLVEEVSRSSVKDMCELNYRRTLRDAKVIRDNIERHNDAEFRAALYEHFAEVDKLKRKYAYKRKEDSITGEVASVPFASLNNATKAMVDTTWDNVMVDLISSSYTLEHQLRLLQEVVDEQQELSLMYRFADLIDREFDFEHKEKEMATFVSRHQVNYMR